MRGVLIALLVTAATAAAAAEATLTADARTALHLTLYQGGFAHVQDSRRGTLPAGAARVTVPGVSPRLVPASVVLTATGEATVGEIGYALERLSAEALLRRAVGRTVDVVRTHPMTGADDREPAEVLAVDGGIVLRYRQRIETGVPGRLVFRDIPAGLTAEPALIATIAHPRAGEVRLDLGYLTEGLDWSADYALELDEAAGRLALACRALLTNTTGIDFHGARLALVAGEVRRLSEAPSPPAGAMRAMMADAAPPPVPAEELADRHVFSVAEAHTIADRQSKQIPLFARGDVAVSRSYVAVHAVHARGGEGGEPRRTHPEVTYAFRNAGGPLPAGIARLAVRNGDGLRRPIGEDRIAPTPDGGEVRLSPGRAFDITVLRRQTDYQEIGSREQGIVEAGWQIEVGNARREDVTVRLVEVMPGGWTLLAESAPHRLEAARRPAWELVVPAGGTARLDYRVRLQR